MNSSNSKSTSIVRALRTQSGAFDVRAMQVGVAKFPKGIARALRRGKALPAKFLEGIDPQAPLEEQVAQIWHRYATWAHLRPPSKDGAKDLNYVQRILRLYQHLRDAGCKLPTALSLREKHSIVLLAWLRQHHQPATIRSTWSILRTWCLAMGKQGMVKELTHYWPDAPKWTKSPTKSNDRRDQDAQGYKATMCDLQRASDPTHWLVERLCADLGLTVGQALQLDAAAAAHYRDGFIYAKRDNENSIAVFRLDTEPKRALVAEVLSVLTQRARKGLCWPDLTVAQGIRKHQQRMNYVRAKVRKTPDDAPGQAGRAATTRPPENDE